jgi:hypothetical protein
MFSTSSAFKIKIYKYNIYWCFVSVYCDAGAALPASGALFSSRAGIHSSRRVDHYRDDDRVPFFNIHGIKSLLSNF